VEPAGDAAMDQQQEATVLYTGFSITSPVDQRGIRANDGNITVQLSVQPELQPDHMIVLTVDGEDGEATYSSIDMTVDLTNLSRGQHTLMATVVDAEGNKLIQSEPVTFFVLRVPGG
jgi:phosphatidate phosphatase APP1